MFNKTITLFNISQGLFPVFIQSSIVNRKLSIFVLFHFSVTNISVGSESDMANLALSSSTDTSRTITVWVLTFLLKSALLLTFPRALKIEIEHSFLA
ncbi:MAG: hypothetical protein A2231_05225 [Candidatus Firestonebacteria bacterium RIFOXYA2_FULL_40_8]|nr:MAG: hypothetical protein A2231_05225 [Candidatus Firestonebacteria bacterium RIFOXYA2_FULL_40_8]